MNTLQTYSKWTLSLAGAILVLLSGCAKENNPRIAVVMSNTTAQNRLFNLFLPSAHATVTDTKLCFKRLRFKLADDSTVENGGSHNIDFTPGEVSLASSWLFLGEVTVPAGNYRRIEFDIEKNCGSSSSGKSISFTNNYGQFWSDQTANIIFEGKFEASRSGQQISLNTLAIINALNNVMSLSDVKPTLLDARVKGSF
jgi:hypothetical protein